jgi:hypothetical protein
LAEFDWPNQPASAKGIMAVRGVVRKFHAHLSAIRRRQIPAADFTGRWCRSVNGSLVLAENCQADGELSRSATAGFATHQSSSASPLRPFLCNRR